MNARILAMILQVSGGASAANPGFLTAADLEARCASSSSVDVTYCYSYLAGVHDTIRAYEVWLDSREFCPESVILQGDLLRIFRGYISAYPEMKRGQAASTVMVALKAAFPCYPIILPQEEDTEPALTSQPKPTSSSNRDFIVVEG